MKTQGVVIGLAAHAIVGIATIIDRGFRIVGGQDAKIENFRYQVNLFIKGEPGCGGTILDKRTILTASHCTSDLKASQIIVHVGSNRTYSGTPYKVASFARHPKYNSDVVDYDAAVLKLAKDLKLSSAVQPIGAIASLEPVNGSSANVSGYGFLSEGGKRSKRLQYVSVPIVGRDACKKDYGGHITDRMICAGKEGKDSCSFDSGGPLVQNNSVFGIVSFGIGCGYPGKPGVYTDVANNEIHSFIQQQLEE